MPVILKNIFDRPTTLDETLQSKFSRFTKNMLYLRTSHFKK